MAQFTCSICEDGFQQKSRLERHLSTSHPPQAPSAADVEKVLAGIQYPKSKQDLVQYASQRNSSIGQDIFDLIKSLPFRTYRDSADVAVALGELKSGKEVEAAEQPSKKGGKVAATSYISAATIAKVLSGIDFPKRKNSIKEYAKKKVSNIEVEDPTTILDIIDKLPDREYNNMADVEKSVGSVI
ncbi:MAG: DUF2795 domain-containing protein [Nitrososphaeraceae archaeon]